MPKVGNYTLLPNDPSPSPQDLPSLLTWGTLLATPRALDGEDPLENAPSFRLPANKRRDELGRKLADKAKKSMNARAQSFTPKTGLSAALRSAADRTQRGNRGGQTPSEMLPPGATPRREDGLTPAGKRLLERSLGVKRSEMGTGGRNRGAAMEKGSGWSVGTRRDTGRMSWTPSPARNRGS